MMTEEDLVRGPAVDSPWIVEFENIGDAIKFTDDFEGAYDPPFTFETEEYGECRGISNPFSYAHYGYFGVLVPQADEKWMEHISVLAQTNELLPLSWTELISVGKHL